MEEVTLSEAIIACGRLISLIDRKAPTHELLEPLTSLIVYLGSLLEGGTTKGYLAEEARGLLDALKQCREGIRIRRAEAIGEAREYVEMCRGLLKAILGLRGVEGVENILIGIRESLRAGSLTPDDALDRLSEAVSRMRKLRGGATVLEKLEILYEYISSLQGELTGENREIILRGINDVLFHLSREDIQSKVLENFRTLKPEALLVEVAVRAETYVARTPFFLGREPKTMRLCIRDAGRFIEAEAELVATRSEELRLEADLFPPIHIFGNEVSQGLSRLQAYIYACEGLLYLVATGRRPMRIARSGTLLVTRGGYSGEIVELGYKARIEIEGVPPIGLSVASR